MARVFASIVVLAAVVRVPSFTRPLLDSDEAQYAAIAELVRTGGRLYAEGGVDNKPPGIYWTYAAIFEAAGSYAMWAVHLVALVVAALTACVLAAITARLAGRRAGLLAGVFYALFTTVYYPKMLAANTEVFVMLPLAAMVWCLLFARSARGWIAAGALLAIACAYKQTAILSGVAVIVAARRAPQIAWAALGFACVGAACIAAVAYTGSLDGMWHWTVVRLFDYGASAWSGGALRLVQLFLIVASSLLLWVAMVLALRRIREASRTGWVVWSWLAASIASALAGGQMFGHYFIQVFAPLSVIAAIELARRWSSRATRVATVALSALPAAGFFVINVLAEPITGRIGTPRPDFRAPVAWVRAHTSPDDRILVWGMFPAFYVLTERLPASRFVGFMRGAHRTRDVDPVSWDTGAEVWPQLAADLAVHRPAIVIDTSTAGYESFHHYPMTRFPALAALIARDYHVVAVVDGVTMYGRR